MESIAFWLKTFFTGIFNRRRGNIQGFRSRIDTIILSFFKNIIVINCNDRSITRYNMKSKRGFGVRGLGGFSSRCLIIFNNF